MSKLSRWVHKKDWKGLLKAAAPVVATALGTPLAGAAASALAKGLGVDAAEIETAIVDPANLVKLREIEDRFKIDMERIGVDIYAMEVDDRKSARSLFAVNVWPQIVLSTVFVTGFFFVLFYVFKFDPTQSPVLTMVIGALTAGLTQVMNFWFGSTHGSRNKDGVIANNAR